MAQLYGKKTSDGLPKALECTDEGLLKVDTELTATIDPTGLATQTTLAAVLAKLSADPATQTTLAAVLAKLIAAPSTEAKQDALAAIVGEVQASPTANTLLDRLKTLATLLADPASQTTLAAILAKIIAAPATEAKQDTGNASLSSIDVKLPAKGGSVPVSGQKTVTTAGTAVAVGGDVDSRDLVVIADPDNSGDIYVGDSSVDAATGVKLPPGGILPCGNVNLAEIYIDADNDGEGISYYYTT